MIITHNIIFLLIAVTEKQSRLFFFTYIILSIICCKSNNSLFPSFLIRIFIVVGRIVSLGYTKRWLLYFCHSSDDISCCEKMRAVRRPDLHFIFLYLISPDHIWLLLVYNQRKYFDLACRHVFEATGYK